MFLRDVPFSTVNDHCNRAAYIWTIKCRHFRWKSTRSIQIQWLIIFLVLLSLFLIGFRTPVYYVEALALRVSMTVSLLDTHQYSWIQCLMMMLLWLFAFFYTFFPPFYLNVFGFFFALHLNVIFLLYKCFLIKLFFFFCFYI